MWSALTLKIDNLYYVSDCGLGNGETQQRRPEKLNTPLRYSLQSKINIKFQGSFSQHFTFITTSK
jgi:hypothetical protein